MAPAKNSRLPDYSHTPWTDKADAELHDAFTEGLSIESIAQKFGRTRGAIVSRLDKVHPKLLRPEPETEPRRGHAPGFQLFEGESPLPVLPNGQRVPVEKWGIPFGEFVANYDKAMVELEAGPVEVGTDLVWPWCLKIRDPGTTHSPAGAFEDCTVIITPHIEDCAVRDVDREVVLPSYAADEPIHVSAEGAPLDFEGDWLTSGGHTAEVQMWLPDAKLWEGYTVGKGTCWWTPNGKNTIDSKCDLAEKIRQGKCYK